jgi:hypothetical protein
MVRDEIRQVRRDLLKWAWTKPDQIRFRAVIIVGNLHRLEHWPDPIAPIEIDLLLPVPRAFPETIRQPKRTQISKS